MAKRRKSNNRFQRHLENLKSVCPDADDVFVCPICFSMFSSREVLNRDLVNLGHIWPGFIRASASGDSAKHQQILLCKSCNSKAGYRGDNEMQMFEETRQGEKMGKPSRKRRIFVRPSNGDREAQFQAYFSHKDDKNFSLTFRERRDKYEHNENFKRYREYAKKQIPCDVIVYPYDINLSLAFAGWLTSAYLFAFYTFGYRFILHKSLDPVREYILQSFERRTDNRLDFHDDKTVSVRTCAKHFFQKPTIDYMIPPIGNKTPHHLEVSFLDYHVRLPGRDNYIDDAMLNEGNPQDIMISMNSENHIAHAERCHWDDLFDDIDYYVQGSEFISLPSP